MIRGGRRQEPVYPWPSKPCERFNLRQWDASEELYYGFSELRENDKICILKTPWS